MPHNYIDIGQDKKKIDIDYGSLRQKQNKNKNKTDIQIITIRTKVQKTFQYDILLKK